MRHAPTMKYGLKAPRLRRQLHSTKMLAPTRAYCFPKAVPDVKSYKERVHTSADLTGFLFAVHSLEMPEGKLRGPNHLC